jgi:CCR4-NOT transcriptional regulation complex NOT5 subunit
MSGKYIPPSLRKKMAAAAAEEATKKKGVRWPSNAHGDPSYNVKYKKAPTTFRNNSLTRTQKYKAISKKLSTRKLRNKPVKGLLKGKTAKVRPNSAPAAL